MISRDRMMQGLNLRVLPRRAGRIGVLLVHGNFCKEVFSKQLKDLAKSDLAPGLEFDTTISKGKSTGSISGLAGFEAEIQGEGPMRPHPSVGDTL